KLGYSYNAVYRWEANIKPISWNELIDLVALKRKIDSKKFADEFTGNIRNFRDICNFLIRENEEQQIESLLQLRHFDRRTLKRWLAGTMSPPAEFVFELFETHSKESFTDFLNCLFDIHEIDPTYENFSLTEKARPFFGENVLAAIISEGLHVKEIQEKGVTIKSIADYFNLPELSIQKEVERMLSLGWLVETQGRLSVNYDKPINLFPQAEQGYRLGQFIARLAEQSIGRRIGQKPEDKKIDSTDYLSFWIASLSSLAAKKVHDLAGEYNKKLLDVLKEDLNQNKDVLKVIFFQTFDVDHRTELSKFI
ncbi:MAG TPA: hypothetical protein PLJ21_10120, partial [Pseudobdellovibrionaceae bacterium]|nr:hypothetical protein [Pseudobdellovibrionaceae bacterium]